jgi:hypothetical protein
MRLLLLILALTGCEKVFSLVTVVPDAPVIDAPPRPDAPAGVCGEVGTPCCAGSAPCNAGALCLGSGAQSRCVDNAGIFGEQPSNPCGTSECDADPYTGACSCPTGFTAETADIDGGCGADLNNPMHAVTKLSVCAANAFPPNTDWGDFYIQADIPACTPATPNGCYSPNHITGACTCPGTTHPVGLRIFIQGVLGGGCVNGWLGASLTVCLDANVAAVSVLGVYEKDPNGACRISYPMRDCNCPGGSLTSNIPVFTDGMGPTGNVVFMRSTITMCLAPP